MLCRYGLRSSQISVLTPLSGLWIVSQQGKDQSDSRWHEKQTGAAMTDIEIMQAYLMLKVRQGDWHGVADAAMDIREMEARKAVEQKNEMAG